MQTFLPYKEFDKSAEVLDSLRLGNQRNEAFVLLTGGWPNHPASRMWRGHRGALATYALCICDEYVKRGNTDGVAYKIKQLFIPKEEYSNPWWLGDERLHASHRSNLLRKDYEYYTRFDWYETPFLDYWWPTQ